MTGFEPRERLSAPVAEYPIMATATQKIALSASRDIPFNKLVLSQSNVRRIKAGISVEDLAEDIARRGLLQSLNVRPVVDADGAETGMFEIPAGGRRYRALELLTKKKRLCSISPAATRLPGLAPTAGLTIRSKGGGHEHSRSRPHELPNAAACRRRGQFRPSRMHRRRDGCPALRDLRRRFLAISPTATPMRLIRRLSLMRRRHPDRLPDGNLPLPVHAGKADRAVLRRRVRLGHVHDELRHAGDTGPTPLGEQSPSFSVALASEAPVKSL